MISEFCKSRKTIAGVLAIVMLLTVFLPAGKVSAEGPEVTLSKSGLSLKVGKTESLTAKVKITAEELQSDPVSWSSSNKSVVQVNTQGKVTAKAVGQATVTARAGDSAASCTVKVSLDKPKKIKTRSLGVSKIKVSWSKVAGASSYQLFRSTSKYNGYKKVCLTKKTSYNDSGRTTGKIYYYRVKAYKSGQYSDPTRAAYRKARPASTKVRLKPGQIKIKIGWKKVSGIDGYKVYRATKKKGKYKGIINIKHKGTTKYVNKYLIGGKRYYYKVKAYKTVKGDRVYSRASSAIGVKAGKTSLKYNSKHKFYYKKKLTVKAYAYTGGGTTATGTRARVGAIAVDPRVIALKSNTYVDGYGYAKAEDTGGNIKGKTVDLYKNSQYACRQWGVRYKTIYVGIIKIK